MKQEEVETTKRIGTMLGVVSLALVACTCAKPPSGPLRTEPPGAVDKVAPQIPPREAGRPERPITAEPPRETLEWKLAAINAGTHVPYDHPTVSEFRLLLDSLTAKCTEGRQEIADMTVKAQELLLSKKGVAMKLLDVMKSLDATIPKEAAGGHVFRYAEVAAAFLTLTPAGH